MFISGKDRKGGSYYEFQFCKIDNPIKANKVISDVVEHWKDDSLLIYDENFDIFYKKYGCIFDCAIFPNGEKGFDYGGINYYDKETTKEIIDKFETVKEYEELLKWLNIALEKYNGFYILGL